MGFRVDLPVLVFQRFPKVPYPVKILKGNMRKVERREYEEGIKKEKVFMATRCFSAFAGQYGSACNTINCEVALEVFGRVPKDFGRRNEVMVAMSGMMEEISGRVAGEKKVLTEEQQKEEMIKEMTNLFPDLKQIFSN
eukprot:TRINITY_DN9681_c0_g2_i1.p1 TRINITY_DN9681_c0_g2~~TRINITY_DN9681_c0_g2_i1.p1  ORF type:complete len:138 (+),score=56.79 TRINITY_DN9681_c0_g2_i1:1-414(+)